MKVGLMITCLGDAMFPNVGIATVRLLRRLGVEVEFPAAQTCCGQPFFNSGFHDHARDMARHTIEAFARQEVIVTPSGSCAAMVKMEFPELFHGDARWHARAVELAARTHELTQLITKVLGVEDVGASYPIKAAYHMACHLRGLGGAGAPERLLAKVRGLELVPLERHDECCGFGGSFSVRYPGISGSMVSDKCSLIEKSGAEAVIATDAGCLMNIAGCLRRRGSPIRPIHIAEVLAMVSA